jgi:hypothetical protein
MASMQLSRFATEAKASLSPILRAAIRKHLVERVPPAAGDVAEQSGDVVVGLHIHRVLAPSQAGAALRGAIISPARGGDKVLKRCPIGWIAQGIATSAAGE